MPRNAARRLVAGAAVFTAGVGASLSLSSTAAPQAVEECPILDVCVTLTAPTLPVPLPTTTGETTPPAETTAPAPAPTSQPTTGAQTSPAPAAPTPAADGSAGTAAPAAAPRLPALSSLRVAVERARTRRTLRLTFVVRRPATVTLALPLRPRAVRARLAVRAGRSVRRLRIPPATRPGVYTFSVTVRDGGGETRTLRRRVSIRR